jgi:hypothetical protein
LSDEDSIAGVFASFMDGAGEDDVLLRKLVAKRLRQRANLEAVDADALARGIEGAVDAEAIQALRAYAWGTLREEYWAAVDPKLGRAGPNPKDDFNEFVANYIDQAVKSGGGQNKAAKDLRDALLRTAEKSGRSVDRTPNAEKLIGPTGKRSVSISALKRSRARWHEESGS